MQQESNYIPALRYRWLTDFYDPIVALTTRERKFKNLLVESAAIRPGDAILDVGCGTGTLAITLKRAVPGASVTGIDGDLYILQIATRKSDEANVSLTFDCGLSFEMPYHNEVFDVCLSTLFFHHLTLENKARTLQEMYRVLKPGGTCHIADWGKPTNMLMRLLFFQIQMLDGFNTTQPNIEGCLSGLMESSGFEQVKVTAEVPTVFGTMTLYSMRK